MSEYEALLACWRSGQIPERAWIEHLKDEVFRKWLAKREASSNPPDNDRGRNRAHRRLPVVKRIAR